MRTMKDGERLELAIVMLFLLLLVLPAVAFLLGGGRGNDDFIANNERRIAATMPPDADIAATGRYTRSLERVIADRFPLRTPLIVAYDWAKFTLLGDSASSDVLRGRNGFLFLGDAPSRAYISGRTPADADLDYMVQVYKGRADFVRSRGARFVLLFPPDKSTIYPELLPDGVTLVRPTGLERLIPRLRAAGIETLDVTPAVRAAAQQGDAYSHGDTHWNSRGSFAAYRVIAEALRSSGMKAVSPSDLHETTRLGDGDLLRLAGVGLIYRDEKFDYDFVKRAKRVETPQYAEAGQPREQPYATVVEDPSLPTAVFFGDSFALALRPFVSEGFRRVLHVQYAAQPFNEHIIVAEHPNVVIQELVERNLAGHFQQ